MFSQYNLDRNILNSDGDAEIILSPNMLLYFKTFYEGRKKIGSMPIESQDNPDKFYHSCAPEAFVEFKKKFTSAEIAVICSSDHDTKISEVSKLNKKLAVLLERMTEKEAQNIIREAGLDNL